MRVGALFARLGMDGTAGGTPATRTMNSTIPQTLSNLPCGERHRDTAAKADQFVRVAV